ncbi:MAG: rhodanese-like domain-containing protein [Myxococcota bacterium]
MKSRRRRVSRSAALLCSALALTQADCGRRAFSAEVPAAEILADIDANAAPLILDVRTPQEFAAGHVPGARNISIAELPQRLAELASHREREVVVYCERGPRAARAADLLADAGFVGVRRLEGDMAGWREGVLPIDREPNADDGK